MSFFGKIHERILRKFIYHNVEFVLVGGHAAVYYGVRRTTGDIDLLVRPTPENGKKIIRAFKDLRLAADDIDPEDFGSTQVFTFGMEPDAVDIMTSLKGVSVDDVFDNAIIARLDEMKIPVIDINDLLANKQKMNRSAERNLVDQQDILALKRILKNK